MDPQYATTAATRRFSFSADDRAIILKAGRGSKLMGIILFVEAGLNLLNGFNVVGAGLAGVPGLFFFQAGQAIQRMEMDDSNDVTHLMESYDKLGTMFLLRLILVCLMFLFLTIGMLVFWSFAASGELDGMFDSMR